MNPLLWLSAIISVPCFIASLMADEPYRFLFFIIGVMIPVFALGAYIYFAIKDPDRLQDEEYRLRDKALTIFGDSSSELYEMDRIIHGYPVTPQLIEAKATEKHHG